MSKPNIALYLDLELTCDSKPIDNPQIIQIGLVKADLDTLSILDMSSHMVRPNEDYTITEYCTNLTGITSDIVKKGKYFHEVLNSIKKRYPTKNSMSFCWGDDKKSLDRYSNNPFKDMMNLSWFFHLAYPHDKKISLDKALEIFNISFEGRRHDAMWDALATARIHFEMIRKQRSQ